MAGEITSIRDGLQVRLETISGLNIYNHTPDHTSVTPAACIGFDSYTPNVTFEGASTPGDRESRWIITVRLAGSIPEEQWEALDDYINPTGTNSIFAAIKGDETLGGIADYAVISPGEEIDASERVQGQDSWFYQMEFPVTVAMSGA